jgi:hypothetical protein
VRPVEARPDRTERTESSTEFSQHFYRENHNSVFTSSHFHRNKFLVFLAFPKQFPAYEAKRHAVALFIQISYYNIANRIQYAQLTPVEYNAKDYDCITHCYNSGDSDAVTHRVRHLYLPLSFTGKCDVFRHALRAQSSS